MIIEINRKETTNTMIQKKWLASKSWWSILCPLTVKYMELSIYVYTMIIIIKITNRIQFCIETKNIDSNYAGKTEINSLMEWIKKISIYSYQSKVEIENVFFHHRIKCWIWNRMDVIFERQLANHKTWF